MNWNAFWRAHEQAMRARYAAEREIAEILDVQLVDLGGEG